MDIAHIDYFGSAPIGTLHPQVAEVTYNERGSPEGV